MKKNSLIISLFIIACLRSAEPNNGADYFEQPQLAYLAFGLSPDMPTLKTLHNLQIRPWDKIKKLPALVAFIKNHQLPWTRHFKLLHYLKENPLTLCNKTYPIAELNLYYKGNSLGDFSRIVNAQRARICIEEEELDSLKVPRKYIVFFKENYHIFAELSAGKSLFRHDMSNPTNPNEQEIATYLTPKVIDHIFTFSRLLGFSNWYGVKDTNLLYNIQDGHMKLLVIDTESYSFESEFSYGQVLFQFLERLGTIEFPEKTKIYIYEKIRAILESEVPLKEDSLYIDTDLIKSYRPNDPRIQYLNQVKAEYSHAYWKIIHPPIMLDYSTYSPRKSIWDIKLN